MSNQIFTHLWHTPNINFLAENKLIFAKQKNNKKQNSSGSEKEDNTNIFLDHTKRNLQSYRTKIDKIFELAKGTNTNLEKNQTEIIAEAHEYYALENPHKYLSDTLKLLLLKSEEQDKKSSLTQTIQELNPEKEEDYIKITTQILTEFQKNPALQAEIEQKLNSFNSPIIYTSKSQNKKQIHQTIEKAYQDISNLKTSLQKNPNNQDIKDDLNNLLDKLHSHHWANARQKSLLERQEMGKILIGKILENWIKRNNHDISDKFDQFSQLLQSVALALESTTTDVSQTKKIKDLRASIAALSQNPDISQPQKELHKTLEKIAPSADRYLSDVLLSLDIDSHKEEFFRHAYLNQRLRRQKHLQRLHAAKTKITKIEKKIKKSEEEGDEEKSKKLKERKEDLKERFEAERAEFFHHEDWQKLNKNNPTGDPYLKPEYENLHASTLREYEETLYTDFIEENPPNPKEITEKEQTWYQEFQTADKAERKNLYLTAKENTWAMSQARLNQPTNNPPKTYWLKKYQEAESKNKHFDLYIKTKTAELQRQKYNDYQAEIEIETPKMHAENNKHIETQKILAFFSTLLENSKHRSQILACMETDPELLKISQKAYQTTFHTIPADKDPTTMESKEIIKLFIENHKAKQHFAEAHDHIQTKLNIIKKYEEKKDSVEKKHKKDIEKTETKIKNLKTELGKIEYKEHERLGLADTEDIETPKINEQKEKISKLEKELQGKKENWKEKDLNEKIGQAAQDYKEQILNKFEKNSSEQKKYQEAYNKLYEKIHPKQEKTSSTGFPITLSFFNAEEIIEGFKQLWEAYVRNHNRQIKYGGSRFASKIIGNRNASGTLLNQMELELFKDQVSYWQDEFKKWGPAEMESLLNNEDQRLLNPAALFVAVGLIADEGNFARGWQNKHIVNLINHPRWPYGNKITDNDGQIISFARNPYRYMDTIFNQSGWAAGRERTHNKALEGLFADSHKAMVARLTTPGPGESQDSICDDIIYKGHEQLNPFQLAGAFKAARDHKQKRFKPASEIYALHEILKRQSSIPGSPINQNFTHSLCGDSRDKHPFLDYFILKNNNEEKMSEGFRLLRDDPEKYLIKCGIPAAVKRITEKCTDPRDVGSVPSAEGGLNLLLSKRELFEDMIHNMTKSPQIKFPHDRVTEFVKQTLIGGGKIFSETKDENQRKTILTEIAKQTGYSSAEEMIQEKNRMLSKIFPGDYKGTTYAQKEEKKETQTNKKDSANFTPTDLKNTSNPPQT